MLFGLGEFEALVGEVLRLLSGRGTYPQIARITQTIGTGGFQRERLDLTHAHDSHTKSQLWIYQPDPERVAPVHIGWALSGSD